MIHLNVNCKTFFSEFNTQYINLMKNGLSCAFLRDAAGFLKISLYRPFIYYLKSSFARKSQMWWYGR